MFAIMRYLLLFRTKESDYENVASLVAKLGPELAAGAKNLTFYDGLDLLIPSVNYCHSFDGETYYDPYYYGRLPMQKKRLISIFIP